MLALLPESSSEMPTLEMSSETTVVLETPSFSASSTVSSSPSICGNGLIESGEECDDGSANGHDNVCDASCRRLAGSCGDGIVESLLGEQCELSVPSAFPCNGHCRYILPSCGDGKPNPGEECDDGKANSNHPNAHCRPDCRLARCGDGVVDKGEQCDDGNNVSHDGCSATCQIDTPLPGAQVLAGTTTQSPITVSLNGSSSLPSGQVGINPARGGMNPAATTQDVLHASAVQYGTSGHAPVGKTGPATLAVMAAGASAGYAWTRRKKKGKGVVA